MGVIVASGFLEHLHSNLASIISLRKNPQRGSSSSSAQRLPTFARHQQDFHNTCPDEFLELVPRLQNYLNSLDLFIPSTGGVGSNALVDFIHFKTTYKVRDEDPGQYELGKDRPLYGHQYMCHLGSPLLVPLVKQYNTSAKTLVIVGDIWNAMASQHRRDYLEQNVAKLLYGYEWCKKNLTNYKSIYPRDPVGYKMLLWTYATTGGYEFGSPKNINTKPTTAFLKAPYTFDSVRHALELLGMDGLRDQLLAMKHKFPSARAKQKDLGTTNNTSSSSTSAATTTIAKKAFWGRYRPDLFPEVWEMYQPYIKLQQLLDDELSDAWLAHDTPNILMDYLRRELLEKPM